MSVRFVRRAASMKLYVNRLLAADGPSDVPLPTPDTAGDTGHCELESQNEARSPAIATTYGSNGPGE